MLGIKCFRIWNSVSSSGFVRVFEKKFSVEPIFLDDLMFFVFSSLSEYLSFPQASNLATPFFFTPPGNLFSLCRFFVGRCALSVRKSAQFFPLRGCRFEDFAHRSVDTSKNVASPTKRESNTPELSLVLFVRCCFIICFFLNQLSTLLSGGSVWSGVPLFV